MKTKGSAILIIAITTVVLLGGCAENSENSENSENGPADTPVAFDTYAKEVFDCLEDSEPFTLVDIEITDQYPEKLASFDGLLTP